MKKILFVSNEATRTGAPLLLLRFLRWFSENFQTPFRIVLKNGGELEADFRALAQTDIFNTNQGTHKPPFRKVGRFLNMVGQGIHKQRLIQSLLKDDIGLVYSNTATNGEILQSLSTLGCSVISHFHELECSISSFGDWNMELVKKFTDRYICVSEAVRDNLIAKHSVSTETIDIVYGFVSNSYNDNIDKEKAKIKLIHELNIPINSTIIGTCGYSHWLKGPDLFAQLYKHVQKKFPSSPIHFVWVGKFDESPINTGLLYDIEKLGAKNNIHFIGQKTNPLDYLASFDIFVLTSREDSFPLACLEAGSLSIPIVCFDKAGGAKEFVEHDCGFVVPYMDVDEMAEKIIKLVTTPDLKIKLGLRAAQKVRERYDVSKCGPKIVEVLNRFLNNPTR